ncbi:hypothetical protein GCM10022267_44110 [Lentzea roselyniae]|uniref:Uncharacterized protein n=1 Tax=Lentzea roselyniae TaxID=531940 RepID=A0ABP7BAZ8_9PSEU
MLADQRLGDAQRLDQLVHAAVVLAQLQDDGDADRRGQCAQQVAGLGQGVRGSARCGCWGLAFGGVLAVQLDGHGGTPHLVGIFTTNSTVMTSSISRTTTRNVR